MGSDKGDVGLEEEEEDLLAVKPADKEEKDEKSAREHAGSGI